MIGILNMQQHEEWPKRQQLYSGKAKSVFTTDDPQLMVLAFRDDTSAFNGEKLEQLQDKGAVNSQFNAFIMQHLEQHGIPTHFVKQLNATDTLVKSLQMIPVECVVRNRAAGSLCKRLAVAEGKVLSPPTYELFFKDDGLGDPMINESHAITFGWATEAQLQEMKTLTFKINQILSELFAKGGMILVDYKLEYGLCEGKVRLGDEFSPDGCRIWDANTLEKMDKDRFRQNLGNVIDFYKEVGARLGMRFQS
jgi:phosphoribosylaminoimidazole-succinocarboxamide synthase